MRQANRHSNTTLIDLQEFTGGLNYLLPADMLAENECVTLDNLTYDPASGILSTRPAFHKTADLQNVRGAYFTGDAMYVVAGDTLYIQRSQNDLTAVEGELAAGSATVTFAEWDDGVLIACGGPLIQYSGGAIHAIDAKNPEGGSINADHVFVRAGRVALARTGQDTLYYSGVADPAHWEYEGNDADAQFIEIGYKDGGDIAAITPLSRDIVVFKTNGNIYRLSGEYPDWTCVEVARGLPCVRGAAAQLFNSAIFLTRHGLMALDTVQSYGDVQVKNGIGAKVNTELMRMLGGGTAAFSYSPALGSLFINIPSYEHMFVMSVTYGAFTRWQLPFRPVSCGEMGGSLWYAGTDGLYLADMNSDADIADIGGEPAPVRSRLVSKTFRNPRQWLVKRIHCGVKPLNKGIATIRVGSLENTIETGKNRDIAFTDTDYAYSDIEPLVDLSWEDYRFTGVWRGSDLICEVQGDGRICVKIYIDAAKVG